MSKAANNITVVHYAEIDPKYDRRQVMALCGFQVPRGQTTSDKAQVNCFGCFEKLQEENVK